MIKNTNGAYLISTDIIKAHEYSYNGQVLHKIVINTRSYWLANEIKTIDNVYYDPFKVRTESKMQNNKDYYTFIGSDLSKIKQVLATNNMLSKSFAISSSALIFSNEGLKKYIQFVFESKQGNWHFYYWAKGVLLNERINQEQQQNTDITNKNSGDEDDFKNFKIFKKQFSTTDNATDYDFPMASLRKYPSDDDRIVIRFNSKLMTLIEETPYFELAINKKNYDIAIIPTDDCNGVRVTHYKEKAKNGKQRAGEIRVPNSAKDEFDRCAKHHEMQKYVNVEILKEPKKYILIRATK